MARRRTFYKPINRSDPKRRTYKNVVYDSLMECKRARVLDLLGRGSGPLTVERQVKVQLGPDFSTRVDFVVSRDGEPAYAEEVKGWETPTFRTVKRLWRKYGPYPMVVLTLEGSTWTSYTVEGAK